MKSNVCPEHRTSDFDNGGGGREAFEYIAQPHSEVCQDFACRYWRMRLAEELERHLSVRLDHGFHGCLLGKVCHRVYVNTICSIIGLQSEQEFTLQYRIAFIYKSVEMWMLT